MRSLLLVAFLGASTIAWAFPRIAGDIEVRVTGAFTAGNGAPRSVAGEFCCGGENREAQGCVAIRADAMGRFSGLLAKVACKLNSNEVGDDERCGACVHSFLRLESGSKVPCIDTGRSWARGNVNQLDVSVNCQQSVEQPLSNDTRSTTTRRKPPLTDDPAARTEGPAPTSGRNGNSGSSR
jgi:hypothetical protein